MIVDLKIWMTTFLIFLILFTVIELACGEYGAGCIDGMVKATDNGKCLDWFEKPENLPTLKELKGR